MARRKRIVEEPEDDPPDDEQQITANTDNTPANNDVIISYFTDEEYTIVLKQFNTIKDRSIKNKEENIKKEKDDYATFKKLKKPHYISLMGKHFFSSPLGTSPRFDDRINQFLDYHLSKRTDTKPFKVALQSHGIHSDKPMAGESIQEALIRTLLTKVPMEPLASIQIANTDVIDSLVMFDRGGFYTGDMKNNASKFHKEQSDRIGSLKKCLDKIVEVVSSKTNSRKMVEKINSIIGKWLKVPLPWDPYQIIDALGNDPSSKSGYVQVFLCPLRTHIGKSDGSKTGKLLSMIESQFFSGIISS